MNGTEAPPFVQFPVELVRKVLEMAAFENRRSACAIARTSSRSAAWMTPILYHTIILRHPSTLLRLIDTLVHYKPRLCTQVRNVALEWENWDAVSDAHVHNATELTRVQFAGARLLQYCTDLRSFAFTRRYPLTDQAFAYAASTLSQVHILSIAHTQGTLTWHVDAMRLPTITHLCISTPYQESDDNFYDELLCRSPVATLPNLSHLALMACDIEDGTHDSLVRRIREALVCRRSLVLLVVTVTTPKSAISPLLIQPSTLHLGLRGLKDPRLRVLSRQVPKSTQRLALSIWEKTTRDTNDIWARAEAKMKRRPVESHRQH